LTAAHRRSCVYLLPCLPHNRFTIDESVGYGGLGKGVENRAGKGLGGVRPGQRRLGRGEVVTLTEAFLLMPFFVAKLEPKEANSM
jgi:hypothetical protein